MSDTKRSPWVDLPTWAKPIYIAGHPGMLLPSALAAIWLFGGYRPAEITQARVPLFLQGSTDWGGSNIFAVTVVLYVWFGLTGAAWLALVSHMRPARSSFASVLRANIWSMRFHASLFLLFGILTWSPWSSVQDRDPDPDFRNIFVLVVILYAASFLLVTWLSRQTLSLAGKVIASPLMLYLWLVIGADGNTPKAGQMLFGYEKPLRTPRGVRHGIMLKWYQLCDVALRDL
jgi:hypothetical protein